MVFSLLGQHIRQVHIRLEEWLREKVRETLVIDGINKKMVKSWTVFSSLSCHFVSLPLATYTLNFLMNTSDFFTSEYY